MAEQNQHNQVRSSIALIEIVLLLFKSRRKRFVRVFSILLFALSPQFKPHYFILWSEAKKKEATNNSQNDREKAFYLIMS